MSKFNVGDVVAILRGDEIFTDSSWKFPILGLVTKANGTSTDYCMLSDTEDIFPTVEIQRFDNEEGGGENQSWVCRADEGYLSHHIPVVAGTGWSITLGDGATISINDHTHFESGVKEAATTALTEVLVKKSHVAGIDKEEINHDEFDKFFKEM